MMAGLSLGRAAEELGKETLASFLITLDLTGHWMTLKMKWFLKSWTQNLRSRVSVVGPESVPSPGFASMGACPRGRASFFLGLTVS